MEILKNCRKAEIYTAANELLATAEVFRDLSGNILLSVPTDFPLDEHDLFLITFFDPVSGLIFSRCTLTKSDEKTSEERDSLLCNILEVMESKQRRQDLKLSLEIPLEMFFINPASGIPGIPDMIAAYTRNISAGGVYFICKYALPVDAELQFQLRGASKPLTLTAKVLRQETLPPSNDVPQYGHGCRFIDLRPQSEAVLRNYIFRQERQKRF